MCDENKIVIRLDDVPELTFPLNKQTIDFLLGKGDLPPDPPVQETEETKQDERADE